MAEKPDDTLATGPKDPVTGQVKPLDGPSERPGTEAEQAARGDPPEPTQLKTAPPDPPPPGRKNRAAPGGGA